MSQPTPDPTAVLLQEVSVPAFTARLDAFRMAPKSADEADRLCKLAGVVGHAVRTVHAGQVKAAAAAGSDLTKAAADALFGRPGPAGPAAADPAAFLALPGVRDAALLQAQLAAAAAPKA